jgi:leucine dehydrogenase
MLTVNEIPTNGYEKVLEIKNSDIGLHGFIAVHNTHLGPALGGMRIFPYSTREEALSDVLRLAKGMTYKSSLLEHGLGGGKSVIIADPKKDKTEALLMSFAEAINLLKGSYITAEDLGTTTDDMQIVRRVSPYVCALATNKSSGDPSRFTAWGVYQGLKAVAYKLWGSRELQGKKVLIQGIGSVGNKLANLLFWDQAELILSDIDTQKVQDLAFQTGATYLSPDKIFDVECDIFSPCALGGILNEKTIPLFKCKAIAGAANNQLLTEEDGTRLSKRGIIYAPDFVINAGGIINAAAEFEEEGYNPKVSRERVNRIFATLSEIFATAEKEGKSTNQVANELAEHKLKMGIGMRKTPITFQNL